MNIAGWLSIWYCSSLPSSSHSTASATVRSSRSELDISPRCMRAVSSGVNGTTIRLDSSGSDPTTAAAQQGVEAQADSMAARQDTDTRIKAANMSTAAVAAAPSAAAAATAPAFWFTAGRTGAGSRRKATGGKARQQPQQERTQPD
ncbi:hypothetical protein PLESTF_000429400 [Pleodorina starrii]|nr:hypothetical protein PLESTF_000429400 [Pleodorina starrii]